MSWQDGFLFDLGDEVAMVQQAARDFAEKEVLPLAAKIDQEHYFPKELIPQMGRLGFMGATVPPELGGSGLSQVAYCLIIEELAAACASTSIIVSAHHSLCLMPILDFGTAAQKEQYVRPLAQGIQLGCFALSEPGTGSDAAAMTCYAKRDGSDYVINGTKNWITNGPEADVCVLFAQMDSSKGHKGVCAFVHPMNLKGISRGKKEDKLGICGSPTCSITYDNVRLSAEHRLGEEGRGFQVAMHTLNGGRTGVAAQAVGIARAALRDALLYSKQRKAFGKLLHEHQSIANYLADMITKVDAARYLTLSAAHAKDLKLEFSRQAAMAKLYASQIAMEVADLGVQIHGGYGYVKDFPAERHLRDAKITQIYEGTSEIQRIVISSKLVSE
jgi:butyryl-CoA dehydrogenase